MINFLKQKNIQKSGFTLVEMMVAIAVFSIVMVVATGALLNVIDANKKAQAIKTAINNVNFALEGISKDMRMGTEYECIDINLKTTPCNETGSVGIKYRSPRAYLDKTTALRSYVYYRYVGKSIEACLEKSINSTCTYRDGFEQITSRDVDIINMKFYVVGNDGTGESKTQPRVVITLTGVAAPENEKIKTTFDLQTSVSQRARIMGN